MANFSEIAHKKVLGVPAIYIAGAAVIILAVVAYKMKPTTKDTTTPTDTTDAVAPTANPYDSLNPDGDGTVVVQQLGPTAATTTTVKTNDDWVREGVVWLGTNKDVAGTQANAALTKYVEGQDRSYDEDQWINAWIKQDGPPPDGVASGGLVGAKAPTKIPTLPGYHTVTGSDDNTYSKLALLYYGHNDQATLDLVQGANINKLGNDGPFAVGTKVYIPAYAPPKYYVVPYTMSNATVAQKNGITELQINALNNVTRSSWSKGAKVRVG